MATLYIHVGMHKTGSSSIQTTLKRLPDCSGPKFIMPMGHANATRPVHRALGGFEKLPPIHRGKSRNELREIGTRELEDLKRQLSEFASTDAVISAEGFETLRIEEFEEFLGLVQHQQVHIIGYIREPLSLSSSVLQQRIKSGMDKWKPLTLIKPYRRRFSKFLDHHCTLIPFDRDLLFNGCVVQDFCKRIGIQLDPNDVTKVNKSLSLDAVKLLFCRNAVRRGQARVSPMPLARKLSLLVGPKMRLAGTEIAGALAERADEIAWMMDVLGASWNLSTDATGPGVVTCEDDLLSPSEEARQWLAANSTGYDGQKDWRVVGRAVDRLLTEGIEVLQPPRYPR